MPGLSTRDKRNPSLALWILFSDRPHPKPCDCEELGRNQSNCTEVIRAFIEDIVETPKAR